MKNTLYFDADFNFLLLECEEANSNSIYINLHTSAATGQTLKITEGTETPQTESLQSNADVNFNLTPSLWAENGTTTLQLINSQLQSGVISLNFAKIPTISAALNQVDNTTFEMRYAGQEEEESGGGSGGGAGSDFDFVEYIRNIQYRLLDEPSDTEGVYDQFTQEVKISWTDPDDIATSEPVPATWAGTVVVRKDGSAPKHRWDGVAEIVDSTTRDQYSGGAYLIDSTAEENKNYYYGIFPYDTRGWYRYTKVLQIETKPIPAPEIISLRAPQTTAFVSYSISPDYTWDFATLVVKQGSEPASTSDGLAVDITGTESITVPDLREEKLYYFKIWAQEHISGRTFESEARAITTGRSDIIPAFNDEIVIIRSGGDMLNFENEVIVSKVE